MYAEIWQAGLVRCPGNNNTGVGQIAHGHVGGSEARIVENNSDTEVVDGHGRLSSTAGIVDPNEYKIVYGSAVEGDSVHLRHPVGAAEVELGTAIKGNPAFGVGVAATIRYSTIRAYAS